jgi:hypothetical protein
MSRGPLIKVLNWQARVFYAFNSALYHRVLDKLPVFPKYNCRAPPASLLIPHFEPRFRGLYARGSRFEEPLAREANKCAPDCKKAGLRIVKSEKPPS